MCCLVCNFDMCNGCINWINTTKLIEESTCCRGHELRESAIAVLKPKDLEVYPYLCRCCNEENKLEIINYCRYCGYTLCMDCKDMIIKSSELVGKVKCKSFHELRWSTEYHKKIQIIERCSECYLKYLGAGFFCCYSCKYYLCVKCFRKKYV